MIGDEREHRPWSMHRMRCIPRHTDLHRTNRSDRSFCVYCLNVGKYSQVYLNANRLRSLADLNRFAMLDELRFGSQQLGEIVLSHDHGGGGRRLF